MRGKKVRYWVLDMKNKITIRVLSYLVEILFPNKVFT